MIPLVVLLIWPSGFWLRICWTEQKAAELVARGSVDGGGEGGAGFGGFGFDRDSGSGGDVMLRARFGMWVREDHVYATCCTGKQSRMLE